MNPPLNLFRKLLRSMYLNYASFYDLDMTFMRPVMRYNK
jgi:hypothetical protein